MVGWSAAGSSLQPNITMTVVNTRTQSHSLHSAGSILSLKKYKVFIAPKLVTCLFFNLFAPGAKM